MKKLYLVLMCLVFMGCVNIYAGEVPFSDVPQSHWAYNDIQELKNMNAVTGFENNSFGLGRQMTTEEFREILTKLAAGRFTVPQREGEAGAYITKSQASVLIIKTLGYENIGENIAGIGSPFTDITENIGYITMACDFGIVSESADGMFYPNKILSREEGASMLMRFYRAAERLNKSTEFLNAFYAIKSYNQAGYIQNFDAVSFGWSRIELNENNVVLNMTAQNNNEYSVPSGFTGPFAMAENKMLMVTGNDCKAVIENPEFRAKAIAEIVSVLNSYTKDGETISFDGVVIDFENLKGESLKNDLILFLQELKDAVTLNSKLIYVAVHPQVKSGEYFDAYDFKKIGEIADKVILMAHDYNAKYLTAEEMAAGITMTPVTPIDEVYYALKCITDKNTGIADKSKIVLQINFDIVQWKVSQGVVLNAVPYNPTYESLYNRLLQGDCTINYSQRYENPYVTFVNPEDGSENIAWYEDSRSVTAKINLAKLFDVYGISLWRLGNVPDYSNDYYLDVMNTILKP